MYNVNFRFYRLVSETSDEDCKNFHLDISEVCVQVLQLKFGMEYKVPVTLTDN
jgi:hypothetical protein